MMCELLFYGKKIKIYLEVRYNMNMQFETLQINSL